MKTQSNNSQGQTLDHDAVERIKAMYDLREIYPVFKRKSYPKYVLDKCVFHEDHKPSMLIFKDGYRCRGCLEHGDVISFVMKTQSLDFVSACQTLLEGVETLTVNRTYSVVIPPPAPVYTHEPDLFCELMQDDDYAELLVKTGINTDTAKTHKIGRFSNGVFSIPIQHPICADRIVDLKLYRPQAEKGTLKTWHLKGGAHNYLYGINFVGQSEFGVVKGGEKDTILGHQIGLPFLTATSGEGSWEMSFNGHLSRFERLYVWLDADDAGQLGTMNIKRKIPRIIVCDWRTLYDPTVKSGFDFADFYKEGGTAEMFLEMLNNANKGLFSRRIVPIMA